jgi:predicted nucleic acid-binding protein
MLVVDASAVTELLLNRPAGDAVAHHLREHDFDLHAPHLLDVEVLSALRRVVAARDASPARGEQAIADLVDLPIERYRHYELIPRIWELRENLSAHDATYVALAEAVADDGATLLTADGRLARGAEAFTGVHVLVAGP